MDRLSMCAVQMAESAILPEKKAHEITRRKYLDRRACCEELSKDRSILIHQVEALEDAGRDKDQRLKELEGTVAELQQSLAVIQLSKVGSVVNNIITVKDNQIATLKEQVKYFTSVLEDIRWRAAQRD